MTASGAVALVTSAPGDAVRAVAAGTATAGMATAGMATADSVVIADTGTGSGRTKVASAPKDVNRLYVMPMALGAKLHGPRVAFFCHYRLLVMGYIYLVVFCVGRVTGIAVFDGGQSSAANLLDDYLRSFLLMGVAGILHESSLYRNPPQNMEEKRNTTLIYQVVVLFFGLFATISSAFSRGTLLTCWAMLAGCAIVSAIKTLRRSRRGSSPAPLDGSILLWAVILSQVFLAARFSYAIAEVSAPYDADLDAPVFRLCLQILPELMALVILSVAGMLTRNAYRTLQNRAPAPRNTAGDAGETHDAIEMDDL
ncbi:hypothetical protein QBC46DRAFT_355648 [Diplogelasinospora grovesii]|uniref:Uncharacterized protein n=1 Tax=Diplogelasinospora grovesii TaxID=303347 RepID=A0AAN6N4L3_9PEZI|nr:hypothetical protein QBC46DRAFT_355648 [Diplogelasinospora grovesii]